MKLSVIVVNHNLCMWLRQCISSLEAARNGIDCEIVVVDNASADKSVEMMQSKFPGVRLIENEKNEGIARALNQAITSSSGEYVFLVSPDTIVSKDTLTKVVDFMDSHTDAAGTSVRMVTPQGHFIRSSKYGLTKKWNLLLKWAGLSKYFAKSRITSSNHSQPDEFETAEIDVLNRSSMLLRRSALNKVGLFDERFVMFGYDVDLSFRLKVEGFKNYYFHKTYVINFNIKPVQKYTFSYLKYYYGAMLAFISKYLFEAPKLTLGAPVKTLYTPQYEIEQ
ncbi:glycosyltransferase family 2 protein [Mucilaginibacter sp. UR6-1]|uniref:glycosyltransferase family 2 protein n=1 Tax=Mucilaginibacter sp. UR6-1 TaxID=1435643 RepID=UPI001E6309D1|nr:glycosyltransferase family 2 protein [Mucilaginibacter sp. UR6-1]MCC8407457.1 glycosyltransferase family 2 protein [Mucilaginibacter sp. UR6-1]